MSEMIDRVARALCQQDERNGSAPWDWYDAKGRERYRESARAALAAMAEPTDAMKEAGHEHTAHPCWLEDVGKAWRAMIDAALT